MLPTITMRIRALIAFIVAVLAVFIQMSGWVTQDQARAVVIACLVLLVLLLAPPILRHYFPRVSIRVSPPPAVMALRSRNSAIEQPVEASTVQATSTQPLTNEQPSSPRVASAGTSIPADWIAPTWQGRHVLPCSFCSYRTVSDPDFQAHMETHTDPPTSALAQEVYSEPRPWARVAIRCLARDGSHFINGVPLDATRTLYTSETRADELYQTGLYERGVVEGHHEVAETHGTEVTCACGWRGDGALYPIHPNL